jgi:protein-S-isoprenylcysteine O-methyltransferase Ste14
VLGLSCAAISLSAYFRSRAYRQGGKIARRLEGPALIAFRIAFALPLYASLVVYSIEPRWMAWASIPVPEGVRWAAAGVAVAMLPAIVWVLRTLGRNVSETVLVKEGQTLVTEGPYRWVRHPLYTVGLTLLTALGLVAANWFMLLFTLLASVAIRVAVIPREEEALAGRFGAPYEAYRTRTGCLLPRLNSGHA